VTGAAFLDRDGVINKSAPEGDYITSWAEFEFLPGVPAALRALRDAGYRLIVVTNQRGIARGVMSQAAVDMIHERMSIALAEVGASVDAVFVCPHDQGTCLCRKPGTALFAQALERFPDISLTDSILVGDSMSDLDAGQRLGCRTFLVGTGERAAVVERRAAERGIVLHGIASSLVDLVADDPALREILTRRQTA
jgi:D-glycero-D-manno-heptose 1,7-bisphosphate phosphatase